MNSNNSEDGKSHDPPTYWRRLLQIVATIPIAFLAMVGASIILQHNTVAVAAAAAVIMPMPFLAGAYFGISIRELPYYWGYVLRRSSARNRGYVSLFA